MRCCASKLVQRKMEIEKRLNCPAAMMRVAKVGSPFWRMSAKRPKVIKRAAESVMRKGMKMPSCSRILVSSWATRWRKMVVSPRLKRVSKSPPIERASA